MSRMSYREEKAFNCGCIVLFVVMVVLSTLSVLNMHKYRDKTNKSKADSMQTIKDESNKLRQDSIHNEWIRMFVDDEVEVVVVNNGDSIYHLSMVCGELNNPNRVHLMNYELAKKQGKKLCKWCWEEVKVSHEYEFDDYIHIPIDELSGYIKEQYSTSEIIELYDITESDLE